MTGIYPQPPRDPSLSWLIGLSVAFGLVYGVVGTLLVQSLGRAL